MLFSICIQVIKSALFNNKYLLEKKPNKRRHKKKNSLKRLKHIKHKVKNNDINEQTSKAESTSVTSDLPKEPPRQGIKLFVCNYINTRFVYDAFFF